MATTASDIIRRALRLIGALDPNESMAAEDADDALDTLNAMLAEWHESGISLPDYSFSGLTDPIASDAADRDAISYALALRLAPEYAVSISQEFGSIAQSSMLRLRARYFSPSHPVTATYY